MNKSEREMILVVSFNVLFHFPQHGLMQRQSNTDATMDLFLSGINEQHARQESADSGLGLSSGYSLPQTPDDFLANIDDNMDGTSGTIYFAQLRFTVILITPCFL